MSWSAQQRFNKGRRHEPTRVSVAESQLNGRTCAHRLESEPTARHAQTTKRCGWASLISGSRPRGSTPDKGRAGCVSAPTANDAGQRWVSKRGDRDGWTVNGLRMGWLASGGHETHMSSAHAPSSGKCTRTSGNLRKSRSAVCTTARYAMESAPIWASVTRLPAVPPAACSSCVTCVA